MKSQMSNYRIEKPNRDYWNIMKGIGAICIVIGHSWMDMQNFVYLFHVPLFYFISGYLFNEEKYKNDFWLLVKNKMGLWMKYILIYTPFVLLHNFFGYCCVAEKDQPYYSPVMMIEQICHVIIGDGREFIPGPLWFVPSLIMAVIIFGLIIMITNKISEKLNKTVGYIIESLLIIVITSLGYTMIQNEWYLTGKMQITLTALFYVWVGNICSRYAVYLKKSLNGIIGIGLAICLYLYSRNHLYSLVDGFISPEMFIIAIAGIYMVMCFASEIVKLKQKNILKKSLCLIGRASFWIMAIHFGIIRYIDRIYAWGKNDVTLMFKHYLGAYRFLVPMYLILGIGIPTVAYYILIDRRKNDYAK
ncbi:MAG: acyltransferase family protein [Lachnospiraceae bacterium]|nr:acyltransferase family protein [Lachnospiraceae bacterium]